MSQQYQKQKKKWIQEGKAQSKEEERKKYSIALSKALEFQIEDVLKKIDEKKWVIRDKNRNIKINKSIKELKASLKNSQEKKDE